VHCILRCTNEKSLEDDPFTACSIFQIEKRQAKPLNKAPFFRLPPGFPYIPATESSTALNKKSSAERFIAADVGFQIPKIVIIPP
jgi:hypothetical protein